MRQCSNCRVADQAVMDFGRECSEKCNPAIRESGNPDDHSASCNKVLHEVRPLHEPVILVNTPKSPAGELPIKWKREGWRLLRDGRNTFRVKMLCRECIDKEAMRELVHKDYVKACKAARGQDDRTYGQLMVQQGQG
jgi:hypothetical protein